MSGKGPSSARLRAVLAPLLLSTVLAARGASAGPEIVGVVTDLAGAAEREQGSAHTPVQMLDDLRRGEVLHLASGARVEIAYTAGMAQVVELCGAGHFQLLATGVRAREPGACLHIRDLAAAWRNVRIATGGLARASIALRGNGATQIALVTPRGAQRAPGPRALSWAQPYGRAAAPWDYAVRLSDPQGRLLLSEHTTQQRLTLPADIAWEPGQPYLWTVEATSADGRRISGAGEFQVLEAAAVAGIARLEHSLQAQAGADAPVQGAEAVLLGLALEGAGLHDDAMVQWRRLARQGAALSPWLPPP